MRQVFSFFFDRLTDPLGLPISAVWEYIILFIIGWIAYVVAYSLVGKLYSEGGIHTGCAGSFFHWVIRFFVFLVIWAVTYGVIWLVKFITTHWILILCILGGVLLMAGVVGTIFMLKKKKASKASSDDAQKGDETR